MIRERPIKHSTNEKDKIDLQSDINEIAENVTLDMFHVGTDKINYRILNLLPTDINTLVRKLNITKMPVNVRVNKLEEVGLVKRIKGTGEVIQNDLTEDFMKLVNNIKRRVIDSMNDQIKFEKT